MPHDTEVWCKIWRKIDLFQKWQEIGQFWYPSAQKSPKFALWLVSFGQSI